MDYELCIGVQCLGVELLTLLRKEMHAPTGSATRALEYSRLGCVRVLISLPMESPREAWGLAARTRSTVRPSQSPPEK